MSKVDKKSKSTISSSTPLLNLGNTSVSSLATVARTMQIPDISDTFTTNTATQTLSNKTLDSTTTTFESATARRLVFSTTNSTNSTTLTIETNQTTSQALDIPNVGSGESILTTGAAQTITGVKTFNTAPVISQISNGGTLTLPSGTTDTLVARETTDTLSNKSLNNSSVFHTDNADATKRIGFSSASATTGTTLTLASQQTTSQTLSAPNITAADTVVTLALPQTILDKTLRSSAIGTDSVVVRGIAGQTANLIHFQDNASTTIGSITPLGYYISGNPGAVTANFQALQTTLGNGITRWETVSGTGDNVSEITTQGRVATTNSTQTTLQTFATVTDYSYAFETTVLARRTGGTAGTVGDTARLKILAVYKNIAGTVSITGTINRTIDRNVNGYDATFTISGTNVLLRVTGVNNTNITWHSTTRVMGLST